MASHGPLRRSACLLLSAVALAACATGEDVADAPPEPSPATASEAAPAASPTTAGEGCVPSDEPWDELAFTEARNVRVTYAEDHKVVEVDAPDSDVTVTTVLVRCGAEPPALDGDLAGAQVVEVPVAELATATTANLPHLDLLDATDRLSAVGTGAFVTTPSVMDRIADANLPDLVDASGEVDTELVIGADPDVLVMDGFGPSAAEDAARLGELGVPTVISTDFAESTLLGRAEWIKFTGLFLDAEAEAEAAFDEIASAYRDLADRAATADDQPTVLFNEPFEGTWFVPGGASLQATGVEDAGGSYVLADDEETGSVPLDIETVLEAGSEADIWLQAGSVSGSLDDLAALDERFTSITAFTDGQVWAYDAAVNPEGGNPVFEEAYTRADLYLADLVAILHPELAEGHELRYFGQVPPGDAAGS